MRKKSLLETSNWLKRLCKSRAFYSCMSNFIIDQNCKMCWTLIIEWQKHDVAMFLFLTKYYRLHWHPKLHSSDVDLHYIDITSFSKPLVTFKRHSGDVDLHCIDIKSFSKPLVTFKNFIRAMLTCIALTLNRFVNHW